MSGGYWRLNGIPLVDTNVLVYATAATNSTESRQDLTSIHNGTQYREKVGLNLARKTLEFQFLGSGTRKYTTSRTVQEILETDDVFTLESPSGYFAYRNIPRAAFSLDNFTQDDAKAVAKLTLRVNAIINGVWIADGGTYCEPFAGYFTRRAGPTYERDGTTNTGSSPLLRLPLQTSGYPVAVKPDYSTGTPPIYSVEYESGVFYGNYDLTGFLVPAPTTTGDVGLYDVCSSPQDVFLGGGVASGQSLGIGESEIALNPVGEDVSPEAPPPVLGIGANSIGSTSIGTA